jgi:uncharacterized protein YlxW (UPF0749 family)
LVLLVAGALFATSAISSRGTDLRAGRYGDLATLAAQEAHRVAALRDRANELSREVDRLSRHAGTDRAEAVQRQIDALRAPAGLEAVSGPGLTITLDDAPDEVVRSADIEASRLVVHQQDIQAVANAMWAGGAEAMTIQGQRVISTTGIKCVGNTVILHGVPYSPPYVISAVGDPVGMLSAVNTNPYIEIYQQYVAAYQLGWSVSVHDRLDLPAYGGAPDLRYARPAGTAGRSG